MSKKLGDSMIFTGGAEQSPTAIVSKWNCPGSMHNGETTLKILSGATSIELSPDTMRAILAWYDSK
jgi:hypothetical protein